MNNCALVGYKPTAAPFLNPGTSTGASAIDLDSGPRIKSGAVDFGAYEVQ